MPSPVVLGVGNLLLTDEGAGVHAARRLAEQLKGREDIVVIDGGTLSFTLAPAIEDASQLIVIDAAQLNAPPGSVKLFLGEAMDRFLGVGKLSVHEVSLIDLLDITRVTTGLTAQRALIGVQPGVIAWGDTLTREVDQGVREAVQIALNLLERWPAEVDAAAITASAS